MSSSVMTVCGPVGAGSLGHVQPHDHVFFDISWVPNRWDLASFTDEEQMTEEVRLYAEAGGGTIVDPACIAIGRSPEALRRVSKATGVHIVMGTGWYRQPYYPDYVDRKLTSALASQLIEEIEHGVGDEGIRPGIIGEIGTDKAWMRGAEERVFRAAGRAQRRTGLAVTTHTPPFAALTMYEVLREEGVDPSRIIFGHCDNTLELPYLESVLATGAYLEFDLIGIDSINSDARRAQMITRLVRNGHLEKLLLSCDLCVRSRLRTNGGSGYAHLIAEFIPMLLGCGLTADEVAVMTRDNPQRVLAT